MSRTTKVLIALAAGLGLGIVLSVAGGDAGARIARIVEPVGTLWVNAIRATVIPLVLGSIVVGVLSAPDLGSIGRIGGRSLALFVVLLVAGATVAALVSPPLFALLPLSPEAIASLRAGASSAAQGAGESVKQIPTWSQWITSLVPTNPIRAAADGAMLPLIVFALMFGMAGVQVPAPHRETLTRFFRALRDTSLRLVDWVLAIAPIGVFALALPLALKLGLSAAGALVGYIAGTSAVCVAFSLLVLYPLAVMAGRTRLGDFARAAFPAQAVAFSARSSLGALPAMMEAGRERLRLPEPIVSFFLPLAATTFRVGGALGITSGVLFIARLYGVDPTPAQLATIVLTVVLTTFSVPGIPAGSIIVMVPVLMAAGVPVEGMGILLGADTIPDMFRTTTNVTGDMAAAVVVSRGERD